MSEDNFWLKMWEGYVDVWATWLKGWGRIWLSTSGRRSIIDMNVWHKSMQDFIR